MKGKWRKRIFIFTASLMAGLFMSHGMTTLVHDLDNYIVAHAEGENQVSFDSTVAEANDSGIITVNLHVAGVAGQTVSVTYRTSSGNAIENIDYSGAYNTIALKIDKNGSYNYPIAIKCLNDSSTRETLQVYNTKGTYGRHFYLEILSAENASIGSQKKCTCYLPYDYKVKATTGIEDTDLQREVAYLDDYSKMESRYHKGEDDISGKEHWKTWKKGVSFDNETTRRWVNTYINRGFADAYGSYVLDSIDDDKLHSNSNIHMLSGNKEFMDKYEKSSSTPGLSLYYQIEPCTKGGYRLDGKAMYYISKKENPNDKEGKLVDVVDNNFIGTNRQVYWIQDSDAWYSAKDSLYDSIFYVTPPYNGILDYGLSIYNGNKSWDREVHNIWMFLALIDTKAPKIVGQYSELNPTTGAIRVFLRFNEPVYASKKYDLTVKINKYNTDYAASYVEGNYSDTLVYEIPANKAPAVKIDSVKYILHDGDVGDLAYSVNVYRTVSNNLYAPSTATTETNITSGIIDLARPSLFADPSSSGTAQNVYNVMISTNGNGETTFDTGTVYYSWDKNDAIVNPDNPASYANVHVLTSEERGSFGLTLIKNEALGIDSGDYYLHVLVVAQYGFSVKNTYGPYRLDGDPPEIEQLAPDPNELQTKNYRLQVTDKPLGTSLDSVKMVVKCVDTEGKDQVARLGILVDGSIPASLAGIVSRDSSGGVTTFTYRSNLNESLSVPLDEFMIGLMSGRPQLAVEVYFEVMDTAGNRSVSGSVRSVYDRRTLFETVITPPSSYAEDTSVEMNAKVFDITNATETDGIEFTIENSDTKSLIDGGATFSVIVNGDREFVSTSGYSVKLAGFGAGYYEAVGHITGNSGGTAVDLISKSYPFYLTKGFDDATINHGTASGNLVLTNKVFQIEDASYYYFNSVSASVMSHNYGATYNEATAKWEGGSSTPSFSSIIEAKRYVKYMEYQDMELISITASIASLLNGGSGSTIYVKAPKETRNAIEGQLWIRYKKASWTPTSGAGGWAFYYYGEGDVSTGINVNGLSQNLNASIDAVTNRIVDAGIDRYLVGENYTNLTTHAPMLAPAQMHVARETVSQTKMGNTYVTDPVYQGDVSLYHNNVTIDNVDYPIATNLPLQVSSATQLYFKYYATDEWSPLEVKDGQLLKDALAGKATGLYTIREYDEAGVSDFTVYIDRDFPLLKVVLNVGIEGEQSEPLILDGTVTTITCKNIMLDSIINEADPETYVAIYSYPNRSLQTVLYPSQLHGFSLADGNFYMEVGDRSGNVVSYIVRAADSDIDISVTETEAKTGIIVRTNNRDSLEIYSYEVYLNEVLIDNEFDAVKFYTGSGVYRIEITDIYGNTEIRHITHESPAPDMIWYYLNDSGSYSIYNPDYPVRMVVEDDPNASRVTNVYASTMVRVQFAGVSTGDADIEFEMLDIPASDYTYNSSTGLLSINTLSSWRLRVWHKGAPENDHTYIFRIDSTPPEVSATFTGTYYTPYVVYDESGNVVTTSTFDNINTNLYDENDLVTLDTLRYELGSQGNLTFDTNSIVSGNRIVVHVGDASGIRSVQVTRNGQILDMKLSDEGNLIINGYGSYAITVTDNLGNVSTFNFINVEGDVAYGFIDGTTMRQDQETYGHESVEILTTYEGVNTVLVTTTEGKETFEFHYENGLLTYGQYYINVVLDPTDEDPMATSKVAEFKANGDFVLDVNSDDIRRNVWYNVIDRGQYQIQAMFDDSARLHYKVVVIEGAIQLESSFSTGAVHLPSRFVAALSTDEPSLVLLTGDRVVEKTTSLEYIYITDILTIDKTKVDESIVSIAVTYSTSPHFEEPTVVYKDGVWLEDFAGTEFGFYRIEAKNKYNNTVVYLLSKIASFASIVTTQSLDGWRVTYYQNTDDISSNFQIELLVVSTEVKFIVNNQETSGIVMDGSSILILNREGLYEVQVLSANGVVEFFHFEIRADASFLYEETWIVGYNERAPLYQQGYTNTVCSVVLEEAVDQPVVYVEMIHNDEHHVVLYDNLSEDKVIDPALLKDAIGRYGVGKYEVLFRNKYGDLARKVIHYNNIPSIVLSRTTLANPTTYQVFDMELALRSGFYSNNVLRFSTTSTTYAFTVDGVEYRLDEPKTLSFPNATARGNFKYRITFMDEYGNYVEFDAYLSREDVAYDATAMETIIVGTTTYTKDDICLRFAEGLKATVSVDGQEAVDYVSGTKRYADGEYTFVVRDIAGNTATFTIVHKSVNHYDLTNTVTGEEIIDGGVINDASVAFSASDGSSIKYVVRNGELVTDVSSTTFTITGNYELLIEDMIGNLSYERFTIINNDLNHFHYDAPFEYEVTEVWLIDEEGNRRLTDISGSSIDLTLDGDYMVVVTSTKTANSFNFYVTINNEPPTCKLVGLDEGETLTARDVSITGLRVGDVVKIYKDGELISTTTVALSTDTPSITTGGRYRVVVTNVQGVSVTFEFTRKAVTNVAGSIFFIVSSALVVIGLGIGLIYHTKLKTDD